MRITYTATNRAHHYPLAKALYGHGVLNAFVSGFSRFSPRAGIPELGDTLKRADMFQNLYLAATKLKMPPQVIGVLNTSSNRYIDKVSYKYASQSDIFIYYRTIGYKSSIKLHKNNNKCLCVLEEVNTHINVCSKLMQTEFETLDLGKFAEKFPDYKIRTKAYDEADYILCPSELVKKSFISQGISKEKLIKIEYGFSSPVENESLPANKPKNKFTVLYVGQLHYRKGLRYAINAFANLKHPNKEFVIVGNKTKVTGLEKTVIPDNVTFTGPLKGDALKKQYKEASVFVLPSIEDGFGLVVAEAVSYGVPVIITENTGACDIVINSKHGFIVPAFESIGIQERLQNLADDRLLLNEMSENCFELSKSFGNWAITSGKLIAELATKIEH